MGHATDEFDELENATAPEDAMQFDEAASPAKKRKPTKKAEVIQLGAVRPRSFKAV